VDDDELQAEIVPLLKALDREIEVNRASLLPAIVLDALLARCHSATGQYYPVTDLAGDVNTILHGRGEPIEVSPETIGWTLRTLGLHTDFIPGGRKGLALVNDVRKKIHDLAAAYGVRTLRVPAKIACSHCAAMTLPWKVDAASYERGVQLIAAGCPLDHPDALPGRSAAQRKPFRAEQLDGYAQSCVYMFGPRHSGYLIGLRLGTDCPSGTVITEWSFEPPWPDHAICWDYEARGFIPKRDQGAYRSLLDSPLTEVLNDHHPLRRGYPVEGLLCGHSYQPIPESSDHSVSAKLTLVDDRGNTVALRIAMTVVRPVATRSDTPRRVRPGIATEC
jgi:hypothetical protein